MVVLLRVNGRKVYLGRFAHDIVGKTALALVSSLKGCRNPRRVRIEIRRGRR